MAQLMNNENTKAFNELGRQLGVKAHEMFRKVVAEALSTVELGYASAEPVLAEDGTILSKIDPKTIARTVTATLTTHDTGASAVVHILGEAENDEAHRQYALGRGSDLQRNPFLAAFMRLQKPEVLAKITGLEIK